MQELIVFSGTQKDGVLRKWKHKKPEFEKGDYFFSGPVHTTKSVFSELGLIEIMHLVIMTKELVNEKDGIDYLQVFEELQFTNKGWEETGRKIFFIDQLSKSMLEGNDYSAEQKKEFNYSTILFADEY